MENAKQAGRCNAEQTMSFVTSAICGEALRWFHSLETRGIDNKNWDTVKEKKSLFCLEPTLMLHIKPSIMYNDLVKNLNNYWLNE